MSRDEAPARDFRAGENRARLDERRNDETLHGDLERLNALLEHDPLALGTGTGAGAGTGAPQRPLILVTGLPRSGTTLLMQVLASGLDVAFPDCVVARFWRAPAYGLLLSRHLARGARATTFESDHGTPASPFDPHEFSYFFHRWLDPARPDAAPDWDGLVRALGDLEHAAAQSLLLKGLLLQGWLDQAAAQLPTAVFVDIARDPLETMASLLAARRHYYGDEHSWWSLVPRAPRPEERRDDTPEASVAGQVHALRRELDAALESLPPGRVVRTTYGELCADPRGIVARVAKACGSAVGLRADHAVPERFAPRQPQEAAARHEALVAAYRAVEPGFTPAWTPAPVPCVPVRRSDADARRVAAVVRSGRLMTGERVERLEAALSERLDGRAVACVSSGMAALWMLLEVLPAAPVAMPSFTCEALALAASWNDRPIELLDVDPRTLNLPAGSTTDGILVAPHTFGLPAPIDALRAGIVIEDAALALGATMGSVPCGAAADGAVLSFYATKPTAGACGGAVVARDPALAEEIRDRRQYNHRAQYRRRHAFALPDAEAELALAGVERLEADLARRHAIAARYDAALDGRRVQLPRLVPGAVPSHGRYVLRSPDADALVEALHAAGVGARREITRGLHDCLEPGSASVPPLPATERLCAEVVALPMSADLTDAEVDRVVRGIARAVPVE